MINDYEALANNGMSADRLASTFFKEYFKNSTPTFPINPFQMLTDLGIPFLFRPFKKYDGVYIPAEDDGDVPIIAINLNKPITRQRYSAAHELCHFLKDSNKQFACILGSKSAIEKYAEKFASELLIPTPELIKQVALYEKDGYVDLDSVLLIADYFGVSFKACLNKIAYRLHKIKGDTDPVSLEKMSKKFKPETKRNEKGMFYTVLYEQVIDSMTTMFKYEPTPHALLKFKQEYVFQDSRMEGVDIDEETAAQIVVDLRLKKQDSEYCTEGNQNIIEVAGLSFAYDYAFDECKGLITIYDAKNINKQLYITAPFPEYGGCFRETNTLVIGAKFETIDFFDIPQEMKNLDMEIKDLMDNYESLPISTYIERVAQIHHRLTVIHAFRDGNGRTSRCFANMMLLKRDIAPIFFSGDKKRDYKAALNDADTKGSFDHLYQCFFQSVIKTFATLSDYQI
ncbi:MAG: ImmA/IrrE family metallo-endopeptidase [Ruminococcus sp.]|nr:ImmA/IrrE family metallo-endopeptidase [Ruminococcus sp.]